MPINDATLAAYVAAHPANNRGMCLNYWYTAARAAGMPAYGANLPTAAAAAAKTPKQSAPVAYGFAWFGEGSGPGDVVGIINGVVHATDQPMGHVGVTTIEARLAVLRSLHGPATQFLGYSNGMLGTPMSGGGVPHAGGFPLGEGQYFGPEAGGPESISGYHSHRLDLEHFQQLLKNKGYAITVDGLYGKEGDKTPEGNTATITAEFQTKEGLKADRFIGPATWAKAAA